MRLPIIALILLLSQPAITQSCGPSNWSQADIDNFPIDFPGCIEIPNLLLNSDVTNLDSLYNVEKISGTFTANNLSNLDITGIANIDSIIGGLGIFNSSVVGNFNNLIYASDIWIDRTTTAGSLLFPNVEYIEQNLRIDFVFSNLDSTTMFNSLDSVGGNIKLNNFSGHFYDSFNQLESVEDIEITTFGSNDILTVASSFQNLSNLDNLILYGSSSKIEISNSFISVSVISEELELTNLTVEPWPFTNLISVNDLTIFLLNGLSDLTIFNENLAINNSLSIRYSSLTSLEGLSQNHIQDLTSLTIRNNSNLSLCNYNHICDLLNGTLK